MQNLGIDFDKETSFVKELVSSKQQAERALAEEKRRVQAAEQKSLDAKDAQERMQLLSQSVQQLVHQRISEIVTKCLAAVFDDPYEFKIRFERKRGRTEAELLFCRRKLEVDPLSSSGGGAVDVAAFALRAVCLVLNRPRLSRVLVMDEPFRFVSAEYQNKVRKMLEMICRELSVQIVMVTHNPKYITGTVVEIESGSS